MIYVFFFLIFLSSCVSIPKKQAERALLATPSLNRTFEEGLTQGVIVEALPPCQWWRIFENPSLSYLIEKALWNNPTLQEAMAKVERARNEAIIKRSALFPTVELDAEVSRQYLPKYGFFRSIAPTIPPRVTDYSLGFDFTYEFDFWGKWRNLYRAALSHEHAMEAERVQAELLISTAIASVYFKLQADARQLDLLLQQKKIAESLVQYRKERFIHAIDNANEVLAAENTLHTIQQQVVWNQQMIEIDKHLLLNLVGEGPEQEEYIAQMGEDVIIRAPIPEYIALDLLAYRPDLMAQIWRVEAAAFEVGAAKADFYPNINLTTLVGCETVIFEKILTPGSFSLTLLPALHLPIFTAGRIKANLEAKRSVLMEAIMAYNQLLLDAARDVADSMSNLRAADQNLALQNKIVQNRQETQSLIQQRYTHALNDALTNLDANLEVLLQKRLEIDAQYKYNLATIQLMRALGGGYQAQNIPMTPEGA
jgi:NodT family efflux transporter outer membrane factor (OMF) lipoprotein